MAPEGLTSGRTAEGGAVHVFPVRVYFEDTDAGGIVYHANYLKFAERARTEMLRLLGHDQNRLIEDPGLAFTVRRCEIDYLGPARLDDALEVRTRLLDVAGASMRMEQLVCREVSTLAKLRLRIACVDRTGRPTRLPGNLRDAFENHVTAD